MNLHTHATKKMGEKGRLQVGISNETSNIMFVGKFQNI